MLLFYGFLLGSVVMLGLALLFTVDLRRERDAAREEGAVIRAALIDWITEVEHVEGARSWKGPYETATDRLIRLGRAIRG